MNRWLKGCLIGCGVVLLLTILAGVGITRWVQQTYYSPLPPAPKIGRSVALRPDFLLRDGGTYGAGTAVCVRLKPGAQPIVLTALHLFGPSGGLDQELAPSEIDGKIAQVLLTPIAGGRPVGAAQGALRKTGKALSDAEAGVGGDIAAFRLHPKSRVNALDLAPGNPAMGEPVWLVGDVFDHQPQTQRLFPGRVITVSDDGTVVKFEEQFALRAFSGAPVINARKQVVGLLIGGNEGTAIINPAGSIRKRLAESGVQ